MQTCGNNMCYDKYIRKVRIITIGRRRPFYLYIQFSLMLNKVFLHVFIFIIHHKSKYRIYYFCFHFFNIKIIYGFKIFIYNGNFF